MKSISLLPYIDDDVTCDKIKYATKYYPVHSANLTLIQPTWFAYPYHMVFIKKSDMALLSVIALTKFKCIVSASVTKGALVCFVVSVHWWRHITHYDVTEACHALRNILTVLWTMEQHARTWAESPNTAKWRRAQNINRQYKRVILMRFFIIRYEIDPYLYSGFLLARCNPCDIEHRVGPSALGLHLTGDVSSLGRRRHPSMD